MYLIMHAIKSACSQLITINSHLQKSSNKSTSLSRSLTLSKTCLRKKNDKRCEIFKQPDTCIHVQLLPFDLICNVCFCFVLFCSCWFVCLFFQNVNYKKAMVFLQHTELCNNVDLQLQHQDAHTCRPVHVGMYMLCVLRCFILANCKVYNCTIQVKCSACTMCLCKVHNHVK